MLVFHPPLKAPLFLVSNDLHRRNAFPPPQSPSIFTHQNSNCPFIKLVPPHHFVNSSLHSCRAHNEPIPFPLISSSIADVGESHTEQTDAGEVLEGRKNFFGAVSLIIGTAVGPGMLGLPSATIKAGPFPSTVAIILSWIYVISSIILIAELSFAAMEEGGVNEVSFTALASRSLGPIFGSFVAVVYACLSFSLMIACVSGIGSLILQQFHGTSPIVAFSLFPCFVGVLIGVFPFMVIDFTNRLLCALMLFSISALVFTGFSVGRSNLLSSFSFVSWAPQAIMPSIPVTVLTLGFHVITPYICKLLRHSDSLARKAILYGSSVPLAMVLSWNVVVLGLAGSGRSSFHDPIMLLLSVNSAALPAVQGFAFAALATSLIGYALCFPKQLLDTISLIALRLKSKKLKAAAPKSDQLRAMSTAKEASFVQFDFHKDGVLNTCIDYVKKEDIRTESTSDSARLDDGWSSVFATWAVLVVPIFIASFFQAAFAKALDFAGIYANCFLFGILPPVMAWISRSRKRYRSAISTSELLPGGNFVLGLLFCIALILGFWH